ncbi:MAG: hypothetical protein GY797_14455 [Deltaproteobacteria bacterium]|nr:hypothetical protein [Deltaproteobacteria bacterium]
MKKHTYFIIYYSTLILLFSFIIVGCKSYLGFSTATKFGLDISQRPDQTLDVVMGFQRLEVASIPVPKDKDASQTEDAYSVLGTFEVEYGNPFVREPLIINQLFATGMAARKTAANSAMQSWFGEAAGRIHKEGGEK